MTVRTIDLREVKERKIEDVLREVLASQEVLTVRLPEGDQITIRPSAHLQPLPALEGRMPPGWKDGIYDK